MSNGGRLQGRVALVTGAGRGIGRALALACAGEGATVAVVARSADQLDETVKLVAGLGREAMAVAADITDAAAVSAAVAAVTGAYGRLDVLVNNAGILRVGKLEDQAPEDFAAVVNTNLVGTFLATQAVVPVMRDQGGGKIVNMASSWGLRPVPAHSAYCASKAGIIHFTRVAALELARHNIQVNAIAPGYIRTAINDEHFSDPAVAERLLSRVPARRTAGAEELGPLVCYLASAEADYITGEVIGFDGGYALT